MAEALDYSERAGFLTGKSARLADWQHNREAAKFARLVAVLRTAKWNREHPERRREIARTYAAKPEVKARASARQKAKRAKPPEQCVCAECGETFVRAKAGPRPKWCGDACRQRAAYQARTPGARRIKRHSKEVSSG